MRLLEALLLKLQATVSHPTWLRELNFTNPPKHSKSLGQLSSPFQIFFFPNDLMSSIRVSELLIGARVRVCLQCPGHFTSPCTKEENVSPLIKHHLLYESSGSGRFPPDSVTGCGRDQLCVDLMQVILTSVSSSVKTITDKNM